MGDPISGMFGGGSGGGPLGGISSILDPMGVMPGSGSNDGNSAPKVPVVQTAPASTGTSPVHLYDPYFQYMPKSYFGSQPQTDPSAILKAYMQNMPAFLQASRTGN